MVTAGMGENMTRLLPQDLESESRLIGAALIAHRFEQYSDFDLDQLRLTISPEMFALRDYGMVWQAIVDTADAGEPYGDPAALLARLNGQEPDGGWAETLVELADQGEPANCNFYAGRIRDTWTRRMIIRHCDLVAEQSYDLLPDVGVDDLIESFHKLPVNRIDAKGGIADVCVNDVESESVGWLWIGRIAIGKVTLFTGDPGLGKSFVSLDIAARVSTGTAWPDRRDEQREPASVVLMSGEDALADTIRPRLENAHADLKKIHSVTGVHHAERKDELDVFSLERDVRHLEAMLTRIPDCRLVVIDPVNAFLGSKVDAHKDADVRRVIAPLATVATKHNVALLLIAHLNKSEKKTAIYRSMGSIGFAAAARAVWLIVRDKDDPTKRLMLQVKNNLAPNPGGLAFHISDPGLVAWSATPVAISADEALSPDKPKAHTARDDAKAFLKEILAGGPVRSDEVLEQAKHAGVSERTLKRAKNDLGVRAHYIVKDSERAWYWNLKDDEPADVC